MTPRQWKLKLERQLRPDPALAALYATLARGEWSGVLALGETQLSGARDRLAVLEAMLDALEQLVSEVENPAPLRDLEKSLRDERGRLKAGGKTSDVYRCFLESSYKGL